MRRPDPNQQMGDALAQAQARYFETGQFEPPTAENPVSEFCRLMSLAL